ncbi:MAG: tRNA pseudouridine(55) synthase TruB [Chakrabartia sp.]
MADAAAALHGWIVLDKPLGLGSTQAVSAIKRALRTAGHAKAKVGHGGTLDPLATGVLPIAIGEATKLAGRMLDASKIYDFTISFGTQTDSLDLEGAVIATSDARPSQAQIEAILPRFTGPIHQIPPAYSALKVDGKRAYDLARAGEEVVLQGRDVVVYSLAPNEPLPFRGEVGVGTNHPRVSSGLPTPDPEGEGLVSEITLTAHVSKGTYIRSLARDIAVALGTVGHVSMLRRVKAGPFTLEGAISLDILDEHANGRFLGNIVLPLRTALDDIPALALEAGQALALRQGRVLSGVAALDGLHLALLADVPVALVDVLDGTVTVERGFNQ